MLNIHSCDCNAAKWAERKGRGMLLGEEVWILIGTDAAETNKVWRNGGVEWRGVVAAEGARQLIGNGASSFVPGALGHQLISERAFLTRGGG